MDLRLMVQGVKELTAHLLRRKQVPRRPPRRSPGFEPCLQCLCCGLVCGQIKEQERRKPSWRRFEGRS